MKLSVVLVSVVSATVLAAPAPVPDAHAAPTFWSGKWCAKKPWWVANKFTLHLFTHHQSTRHHTIRRQTISPTRVAGILHQLQNVSSPSRSLPKLT
ncbi:hypothetical protein SVAN01_04522 [Stagonosporopsis vannaccii]|nr:hypothetical protein SVAN01_04522 [Stagonosporopsis vannaccii]